MESLRTYKFPFYRIAIDNGISNCRISPFILPLATVFVCSMNPDAVIRVPNSGQFGISEPDLTTALSQKISNYCIINTVHACSTGIYDKDHIKKCSLLDFISKRIEF